jgi:hypothetical protein
MFMVVNESYEQLLIEIGPYWSKGLVPIMRCYVETRGKSETSVAGAAVKCRM